jgi:hypothetical protein
MDQPTTQITTVDEVIEYDADGRVIHRTVTTSTTKSSSPSLSVPEITLDDWLGTGKVKRGP